MEAHVTVCDFLQFEYYSELILDKVEKYTYTVNRFDELRKYQEHGSAPSKRQLKADLNQLFEECKSCIEQLVTDPFFCTPN